MYINTTIHTYVTCMFLCFNSTIHLFADDIIAYLTIKSNNDCKTLQNVITIN